MNRASHLLYRSFMISFLGALPLGTLNITALRITEYSIASALAFILAVSISEILVVGLLLKFVHRIQIPVTILKTLWISVILFLIYLSYKSISPDQISNITIFSSSVTLNSALLTGLMLSMTNPIQCIFWLGWNEMLYKQHPALPPWKTPFYLTGIAAGTFVALSIYVLLGMLSATMKGSLMMYLPALASIVYGISAIWLLYMFFKTFKTSHRTAYD